MIDPEDQAINDAKEVQQRRSDDERYYFRKLLGTYEGRAFIWSLLGRTGVHRTSFRGENTHETAFAEGERNIGLWTEQRVLTEGMASYNIMRTEAEAREMNYLGKKEQDNG